jgi:hypothetical protein
MRPRGGRSRARGVQQKPDIPIRTADQKYRKIAPCLCGIKATEIIVLGIWCEHLELCTRRVRCSSRQLSGIREQDLVFPIWKST